MKKICSVYRSSHSDEMYLYVNKAEGLKKVPEALLEKFGKAQHAMSLLLTPERSLARVDVLSVMRELDEKGFYLQMPPPKDLDDEMTIIKHRNNFLEKRF